jgi:hypothetical protein
MAAHAHTTTWGTPIGVRRAPQGQGWYAQFKTWLAARRDANRATFNAYWDARRETFRPLHADAAIDLIPQAHARSATTAFCDLGV